VSERGLLHLTATKTPCRNEAYLKRLRIPFKYQLLIPMVVIMTAVLIFPLGYSFVISFQNYTLSRIGQERFIGFANYVGLFANASYWAALRNTVLFVLLAVSIEVTLGFFLAQLLHQKATWLRGFFRSTLLSPMFITPIAVGLIFRFLTNSQLGVIPNLLKTVGIEIDFFGPQLALFSIVLIDVWQWTPFMLLLLLAGMESLPEEPFEAARVDGAQGWRMTWSITLPLMRPIMLAAVIIRMLDAFKVYEYVYAITRGGPGEATETMQYFIYRTGFIYFRAGEAAAMSYTFILVITLMVVLLFRILRNRERSP
jgi:multiple sugar transport system permease protein